MISNRQLQLILLTLLIQSFVVQTQDIDSCEIQDNILDNVIFADSDCTTAILERQKGFNYFSFKRSSCINNLILNNYNISKVTVLYIDHLERLQGNVTLRYLGKLKIVTNADLYLDSVKFLNTISVEITSGYERNNEILPLVSCNHVELFNVVARHFYIHDITSISLVGEIVVCNSLELSNIKIVKSEKLKQLLSDEIFIKFGSFVHWNGAVSSCQNRESKIISIGATNEINFLDESKLFSRDFLITGSEKANVYITGFLASTNVLSVLCNSLNVLDGSKIKFSGPLIKFKLNTVLFNSNSIFTFHNAEIESSNAVILGKITWDGVIKFKAHFDTSSMVDITSATLSGFRLSFDNISTVKATEESTSGISKCVWNFQTLNLRNDLKGLANCHLSGNSIRVEACNFLRNNGSLIKAESLEVVIDGKNCEDLSFSSFGIIKISKNIIIKSFKASKILFNTNSILKANSFSIYAKSSELLCDSCIIIVNGQTVNNVELNKLFVTSKTDSNRTFKRLRSLYRRTVYDCYEPVFVSVRCTVEEVRSSGENFLISDIPHYVKVGSIKFAGALNVNIQEIKINDAAFIVDGELTFQTPTKNINVTATKGFKKLILASVSVHEAVRSSRGTGRIVKGERNFWNKNALQYFNKYTIASDFELISSSEHNECIRSQSSKEVYCPIYFEDSTIVRNTDGLQSTFYAKSYNGAKISALNVGNDVPVNDFAMIFNNDLLEFDTVDSNNQWSNEIAKHKTLLKNSGLITNLQSLESVISSDLQIATENSKEALLKRHRLSGELALNLDNLGAYEVHSYDKMQEVLKKALPDSESTELMWNIIDYPENIRELLQDDALILKLFKCVGLELPVVNLANQDLTENLINDVVFATVGKLQGISSARLLEHLVDNTCSISDKLKILGAKPGVPLNGKLKELFEAPGVWPFWLINCPGGHESCISLQLALNEKSIDNMLPSGAKLCADEHIILDGTRLEIAMDGNVIAGKSIKAKLVGDTKIDGRILANEIEASIRGNLKNVGIISGDKVMFIADNIINLGIIKATKSLAIQAIKNFIAAGFVGSEGNLSVDVANKLTLISLTEIAILNDTNLKKVSQNLAHVTSLIAKGALDVSAGGDILNIGAEIVGERVFISTNDKIITVPLELYNEVTKVGKYCYESYKGSKIIKPIIKSTGKMEKEEKSKNFRLSQENLSKNVTAVIAKNIANIRSKSGSIVIRGKQEVRIIGSDVLGTGDVAVLSDEGNITVKSISVWKETEITMRSSNVFREWEKTNYAYDEEIVKSNIQSGGKLYSLSLKDQEWIGASIKVVSTKLVAGNLQNKANINILPIQKTKTIRVKTKSSGFGINLNENGVTFFDEKQRDSGTVSIKQIPTIIEVEDEFLAYASGKFQMIDPTLIDKSEDESGNIHVKINAEEINLEVAPEIEASYSYINEKGIGIGFSVKGGEFGIKGGIFEKSKSKEWNNVVYKRPKPFRGWIELNAKTVKTAGVIFFARSLQIHADIVIHGIVMNKETESEVKSLLESGIKFGIKSNLGAIAGSTKNIADSNKSRPEELVNTAFEGYKLYTESLKLLSAGHGLSGGIWFYMHMDESRESHEVSQPVPTIINVEDLKIKSSDLYMLGTQVSAYRGYIEAKYFSGHAAKTTATSDLDNESTDAEIPIKGSVPLNIQHLIQKATEKSEIYLNVNIYVSDRLTMKIEGKADLKGVSISAGKLEASFNELVLESLQNVVEADGLFESLGGGISKSVIDSVNIGHNIRNRNRHVVDSLSMIIGRESANIVVAEALRMNGALMANAERDENGTFTDHGQLTLKVGELFVQHIYDYDKGKTLGAALSIAGSNKYGQSYIDAMPTFGSFNKDGFTRSTVGKGNVHFGSCKLGESPSDRECEYSKNMDGNEESLNRDVGKIQKFTTNYEIEPITAYFSTIDVEKLKENIHRNKDGSIDIAKVGTSFFNIIEGLLKTSFLPDKIEKETNLEQNEAVEKDSFDEAEKLSEESELDFDDEIIMSNEEEIKVRDRIFFDKIIHDLEDKYGKEKAALFIEIGMHGAKEMFMKFENIKESQYIIDRGNLIIRLPKFGVITASSADSYLDLAFEIVDKRNKYTFKIDKSLVKLNPVNVGRMMLYHTAKYLVESGIFVNAVEFVEKYISLAAEFTDKKFEKIKNVIYPKVKAKQKSVGKGTITSGNDPGNNFNDNKRKKNPEKSESIIWKKLKNFKTVFNKQIKTNGKKGKQCEYYQWDHLHDDIEVYDSNGKHEGSMDPTTGEMYKKPDSSKTLKW